MGFRPPKASIADRLVLTKRKMEEAKEAPAQPISTTQAVVSSGMSEFQVLHGGGASKFGAGVPRNSSPAGAPSNSASLVTFKPGSSPVKPVTNSAVHPKSEKDVNGPLNLARSGANIVQSVKSSPDTSAVPNVNVQSSNQVVKNQGMKPVVVQAVTGNPVPVQRATPGVAYVPPKSPFEHHNEIARNVQQFLHQPANHPSWTPPSAEYMHSRLCCQICKVAISDADSLLVCDACERGVHLVCLQNYGNKAVPKVEWHCSVCLTQSKGKPLPPKYGKVTRTAATSKAPPVNGAQFPVQGSAETMATKVNHQKWAANANFTKPIYTQASNTVHNSNVLALSAMTAGSQSQIVSTLRPSVGNGVKSEASSNGRGRTGQLSSSMVQSSVDSPPNKRLRSDSSLNSVDSANNIVHGNKAEEISGVKCADSSLSIDATNLKQEAQSKPLSSTDDEMVDHSETQMEETRTLATEERPRTQATFEPEKKECAGITSNTVTSTTTDGGTNLATEEKLQSKRISEPPTMTDVEMADPSEKKECAGITTDTGTSTTTDEGTNLATEEKLQSNRTSESPTITDVEMAAPSGNLLCQSSDGAIEEKLKTDAASEPPVDQSNNLPVETKPSEQSSALNDGGIPTHQSEHTDGLNGNGLQESPCGDKSKSDCNAVSDHDNIQTVAANGVLHPKNEMLSVSENEAAGVREEAKEQAN